MINEMIKSVNILYCKECDTYIFLINTKETFFYTNKYIFIIKSHSDKWRRIMNSYNVFNYSLQTVN